MGPFAYVDPGTAGLVVTSVWGILVSILTAILGFLVAYFIKPLKAFLGRVKRRLHRAVGRGRLRFLLLAVIIITGCAFFTCLSGPVPEGKMGKVLVIGIDALDAETAERMMGEGKLPNLKKLKDMGGYSRLETTIPPETPVAWSAAATGANPGKYGIFDFVGRDPDTYLPRLNLAEQKRGLLGTGYESALKGTPFWRITSQKGFPTTVIRWPVTFPPEAVKGRMLSGLGVTDIKGFLNSYSFYTSEDLEKREGDTGKLVRVEVRDNRAETALYGPLVRKLNGTVEAEVPMEIALYGEHAIIRVGDRDYKVDAGNWSEWIRVGFSLDPITRVHGICRAYLLGTEPDFNMYVTSVQIDPENPVIDITYPREYGKELADALGLFYTLGMPEDTKAVTEGRIGREVFLEQIRHIEGERTRMFWHEFGRFREGVLAFAFDAGDRFQHIFWERDTPREIEEYYMEKDRLIGDVMDRLSDGTVLIIFSDHGFGDFNRSVDMNRWLVENGYMVLDQEPTGEDPGGLFRHVDWNRTRAYALGFASIYVNLKGREKNGIVEPGDRDSLVGEIVRKLEGLADPETGEPAVTRAYRSRDIYTGRYAKDAPDIMIGFRDGYRMSWQSALGGSAPGVFSDNTEEWKGDHLIDRSHVPGVVFTNFRIGKENPNLMDIAPTVLVMLNLDIPGDMDGKSLVG